MVSVQGFQGVYGLVFRVCAWWWLDGGAGLVEQLLGAPAPIGDVAKTVGDWVFCMFANIDNSTMLWLRC